MTKARGIAIDTSIVYIYTSIAICAVITPATYSFLVLSKLQVNLSVTNFP